MPMRLVIRCKVFLPSKHRHELSQLSSRERRHATHIFARMYPTILPFSSSATYDS